MNDEKETLVLGPAWHLFWKSEFCAVPFKIELDLQATSEMSPFGDKP